MKKYIFYIFDTLQILKYCYSCFHLHMWQQNISDRLDILFAGPFLRLGVSNTYIFHGIYRKLQAIIFVDNCYSNFAARAKFLLH